jgi:hypothetical protein
VHLEILVEDLSGKRALEILVPKILGQAYSFRIHSYRGIGHIPKGLKKSDPSKRILLANLPRLLQGYGRTFAQAGLEAIVIVVCDLDKRNLTTFSEELGQLLAACTPQPEARFCIAIEEGEAWFLGDPDAITAAYPKVKVEVLAAYVQDSICGTWETLANAVYPGGVKALSKKGPHAIGAEKSRWAQDITPHMSTDINASPSFCAFRDELRSL